MTDKPVAQTSNPRAEFERWVQSGVYKAADRRVIECMWDAWQARATPETGDGEVWFVVRGGVLMNAKPYGKTAAAPDGEYMLRTAQKGSAETLAGGVKCTHCNGKGKQDAVYDGLGWSDESVCETCGGSGRIRTVEQYLKTLPANWHEDSSLDTWFPLTAEEHERYKRCLYRANGRLIQMGQEPEKLDYPDRPESKASVPTPTCKNCGWYLSLGAEGYCPKCGTENGGESQT